ncbi:MAG TPA: FAD-binding protein [Candidatus Sulfotelmatobacter sp.]|nr:FAD-binding protein [Candidatus Sulfotelmatobacter sp.]
MSQEFTRRRFVKHISAAGLLSLVVGEPSWLFADEDQRWKDISKLDGSLLLDEGNREQMAMDSGAIFHRLPAAVLKPRSREDLVKIIRFANTHRMQVVMRGQGHSQYGQTLVEGGIVVDSSTLNTVKLGAGIVNAQAGASWEDVTRATLAQGLTPPAMGDTMTLSVGGILNVGGISNSSHRCGAVVDTVDELDVVTGAGDLLTCSPQRNRELFELAIAGMGQCGLIVNARIRLVPAPKWVVRRDLIYDDLGKFLRDTTRLSTENNVEHVGALVLPDQTQGWKFKITIGKFCASPEVVDFRALAPDLQFKSSEDQAPVSYLDYLHRETARNTAGSAARKKTPSRLLFITMFVPGSVGEQFVARILATPPETARVTRFSLYQLPIRKFARPMFMLPRQEELALAIFLIRGVPIADGDRAYSEAVNTIRGLVEKTYAVGGKVYPPYAPFFSRADWEAHYGPNWTRLIAGKKKFDPMGILTPGTGMFVAQQAARP